MPTDPRRLRPSELCRLLNSTPLGEVISDQTLRRHRTRAGLRIGDATHLDLFRYTAWLVQLRHAIKPAQATRANEPVDLAELSLGAAHLGSTKALPKGHGQKLTSRQEAVIAALLTEPTYLAAAKKAGIGETTLYRWLQIPSFRAAYRQARRELVEAAIGRVQAGTGQAVEVLLSVAKHARRDSDRVRAAVALLEYAWRGISDADMIHGEQQVDQSVVMNTTDVVASLGTRLRQIEASEIPTIEKSRLTVSLAEALLKAIGVDVIDKRLEAVQGVLLERKAIARNQDKR